jgi:hypothetical protein
VSVVFNPSGSLDIATDPSDLPEQLNGQTLESSALTRCKNLRLNQDGRAITRDGSAKLNATAIDPDIWTIEEQGGDRYTFAGENIYLNESSIESGLTSAQWSSIKYNAFNDTTENIFATNGTDRKRIESGVVYEWGLEPPASAPTLSAGQGHGLTGKYNARYTYVRKVGTATVAESNPSPAADFYVQLTNQTLAVLVDLPTDTQVTHVRLYRTGAGGVIYYWDQDIPLDTYLYGYTHDFEGGGTYRTGSGYQFTTLIQRMGPMTPTPGSRPQSPQPIRIPADMAGASGGVMTRFSTKNISPISRA